MDLRQKVLIGLRWSVGVRFLSQAFTWAITIIVIRLLSPEDYGLMAMAGVFIAYLLLLNEVGLGSALIQKQDIDEANLRQIFGLLLLINSGLFFLLFLIAPLIAAFFQEQRLIPVIRLLSVQFVVTCFSIIPQSLLARDMQFKKLSIVEFLSAISGSITTLVLALYGWGVWSLVWGNLSIILSKAVCLNIIRPYLHIPVFSFKGIASFLFFGGYVTISRTLWFLYTKADTIIIGKLLGKELLGFYSVGMHLASLPMDKISGILNQIAFPAYSAIQTDPQKASSHFLKTVRIMSFMAFPVLWGISSIAPELVPLLLGNKWNLSIVPLQLLCIVIPIRMISNLIGPLLMGLGRPDIPLLFSAVCSVVMPIVFIIGSYWGIIGVSFAWVIFFPLVFLYYLSRVTTFLGIRILDVLSAMTKPVLAGLLMYITIIIAQMLLEGKLEPILSLALLIILGAITYGTIMLSIDRKRFMEVLGLIKT